jgi:DNA invertase Pin-like site-specific DNA recombinase
MSFSGMDKRVAFDAVMEHRKTGLSKSTVTVVCLSRLGRDKKVVKASFTVTERINSAKGIRTYIIEHV